VRIFYAGDVHGSERLWRKFLNAAAFYEAEVLVLGGDLTGKILVPLVELRPDEWSARVLGRDETLRGEAAVADAEKRIRFNGHYPYRCDEDEYRRIERDASYRGSLLRRTMREEMARWVGLAEEKLRGTDVRCFVMPGNDDDFEIDEVLEDSETIVNPDGRIVRVDGYQMLSSAWANRTPWSSPRELPEEELERKLEEIAAELEPGVPTIFNLHCPPFRSTLDQAPELTEDLTVMSAGGEPRLVPVGSTAVRALIERHQPLLGLHGHIHESRGVTTIGRTLCLNPGSLYGEGVLDGALVDVEGDRVVRHHLVSG
jgi:Icc-related predicted phosphoesterase